MIYLRSQKIIDVESKRINRLENITGKTIKQTLEYPDGDYPYFYILFTDGTFIELKGGNSNDSENYVYVEDCYPQFGLDGFPYRQLGLLTQEEYLEELNLQREISNKELQEKNRKKIESEKRLYEELKAKYG